MKLNDRVLEGLAEMVVGDHKLFPYRSSSQITDYFRRCGFSFAHDGTTRRFWAKDRLAELNLGPSHTPDLPSDDLIRIIAELLDPSDFADKELTVEPALEALNTLLRKETAEQAEAVTRRAPICQLMSGVHSIAPCYLGGRRRRQRSSFPGKRPVICRGVFRLICPPINRHRATDSSASAKPRLTHRRWLPAHGQDAYRRLRKRSNCRGVIDGRSSTPGVTKSTIALGRYGDGEHRSVVFRSTFHFDPPRFVQVSAGQIVKYRVGVGQHPRGVEQE
jgi:hypothetical protein